MKKKLFILTIAIIIIVSCKKNDLANQNSIKNSIDWTVKSENGYLYFKDYKTFYSALLGVSYLSDQDFDEWENSMNFKSMFSVGRNFEKEMDLVDSLRSTNLFNKVKSAYSDVIIWNGDTSYSLDAPNVRESKLVNRNGVVRIGDDFLVYSHKGSTTYKGVQNFNARQQAQTKPRSLYILGVSSAPLYDYYKVATLTKVTNSQTSSKRQMTTTLALYSMHFSDIGYRGFVSVTYYAQHKNWLGLWRNVGCTIGPASGILEVVFSNSVAVPVQFTDPVTNWGTDLNQNNFATGPRECVILVSQTLKQNALTINHHVFNTNPAWRSLILQTTKVINDDQFSNEGFWWSYINSGSTIPTASNLFKLFGLSQGDGIFPRPGTFEIIYP